MSCPAELKQVQFALGSTGVSTKDRFSIQMYNFTTRHRGTPMGNWTRFDKTFRRRAFGLTSLTSAPMLALPDAVVILNSGIVYSLKAGTVAMSHMIRYHYHRKELDSYKQQMFYYMRGHVSALLMKDINTG